MSKKLTSVEWLEDMIKNMVYNGADFGDDYPSLLVHIERAKEMENEQRFDNKATRFEVIDHTDKKRGRIVVEYGVDVEISIQDDGQTMKVFLTNNKQQDND